MTSQHTQDAFEIRFENAVTDMHQHTTRGNQPSARVWETIHAGLSETRADAADPRATGPDPAPVSRKTRRMRKESAMDMTLNPGMAAPPSRSHRGLFTWAAVTLVMVLMVSSLLWYGQIPPGDDQNDLAWAPGLGTPGSTPETALSCEVEPLTTDEVMDMVLNPARGYVRLGLEDYSQNSDELQEIGNRHFTEEPNKNGYQQFGNNPDIVRSATNAANTFSTCVIVGSSFQVWSLIDPSIVQVDILSRFPVLRSEEQLREFVEQWGPEKYGADGGGIITRFGGQATERIDGKWIGSSFIDDGNEDLAIIPLLPTDPDTQGTSITLDVSLRRFPNGQWIVTGYYTQGGRG